MILKESIAIFGFAAISSDITTVIKLLHMIGISNALLIIIVTLNTKAER